MIKRLKFIAGLAFGVGIAVFFIVRDLLVDDIKTTKDVIKAVVAGILTGCIAGFFYGWFIGRFSNSKLAALTTKVDLAAGEDIVFETAANHFKGIEGVGGKLLLTNKRLIFTSHKLNIQNHQLSIERVEIAHAERYKSLGLVNNGLAITTRQNMKEKFVVENIDEWLNHLGDLKNHSSLQI